MIRQTCKAVLLSLLSLSATSVLRGQMPESNQTVDIETIVGKAATAFLKSAPQVPGLSIGVLKDGRVYIYNYGTMDKGVQRQPAADTLYPIASVTKTFTGTLLATAVLDGKVKFDDDVRKYLDGKYPNLEYQGHPIRLEHLVNHNSGLPFNLPDIPENRPLFRLSVQRQNGCWTTTHVKISFPICTKWKSRPRPARSSATRTRPLCC